MKKKSMTVIAVIALILAFTVGGALAYYTTDEVVHNVITTGGVKAKIVEEQDDGNGGREPFENNQTGIMPGAEVSKIVTIRNTGDAGFYARVKVDVVITPPDGAQVDPDPSMITLNFNDQKWKLEDDGYWYYKEEIIGGRSTEPLFTTVSFAEEMGNEFKGCKVDVIVHAQTVQSANNGSSVFEAEGWPEAPEA